MSFFAFNINKYQIANDYFISLHNTCDTNDETLIVFFSKFWENKKWNIMRIRLRKGWYISQF